MPSVCITTSELVCTVYNACCLFHLLCLLSRALSLTAICTDRYRQVRASPAYYLPPVVPAVCTFCACKLSHLCLLSVPDSLAVVYSLYHLSYLMFVVLSVLGLLPITCACCLHHLLCLQSVFLILVVCTLYLACSLHHLPCLPPPPTTCLLVPSTCACLEARGAAPAGQPVEQGRPGWV